MIPRNQAARRERFSYAASPLEKRFAAAIVSATKSTSTMSCAICEGQFFLCWGQRMQRRHFFEGLHDQNKNIQVERDRSGDYVGAGPCSRKMKRVARQNGRGEQDQRKDADHDAGRKVLDGKEESVTLVKTVVERKIAVQPPSRLPLSIPKTTMRPETIPTKLISTCTKVNVDVVIPRIICCLLRRAILRRGGGNCHLSSRLMA